MNKKMNIKMKNNTIIAILCLMSYLAITDVLAQAADHSFNYQGELHDGGVPANGEYDISVQMVDGQGTDVGTASVHEDIQVNNGLFNVDVEIGGISYFDGFEDYYFEISVRPGADNGSFTVISPVQALQAVPLATNLVNGAATSGQVLTFNGFQWTPQTPTGSSSPWNLDGQGQISYSNGKVVIDNRAEVTGKVAIGTSENTHKLTIQADTDNKSLRLIGDTGPFGHGARLNFGDGENAYIDEPTDDDLTIHASDIIMDGDIKQPIDDDGAMKYMVHASCGGSNPQSITKSYNGVSQTAITLVGGAAIPFSCRIKFPAVITARYFQVTSIGSAATTGQGATCRVLLGIGEIGDTLECLTFRTDTGAYQNGSIMVLVY